MLKAFLNSSCLLVVFGGLSAAPANPLPLNGPSTSGSGILLSAENGRAQQVVRPSPCPSVVKARAVISSGGAFGIGHFQVSSDIRKISMRQPAIKYWVVERQLCRDTVMKISDAGTRCLARNSVNQRSN